MAANIKTISLCSGKFCYDKYIDCTGLHLFCYDDCMFSDLPGWVYIIIYLVSAHITVIGVTIYLHRHQTHRSIEEMRPWLAHFFRFWLFITTGMITKEWVAVHRKHHATVDTPADPHSPHILGLPKVLFFGVLFYHFAARRREITETYGSGTPEDWVERHIYIRWWLGILALLILETFLFGFWGLAIWVLQILTIPILGAGFVNGLGHAWGYRNYDTPDHSRNIIPLGLIAGGEELHNNHHQFQRSAKFSVRPWEFDIGWCYVWLFQKFSLVAKVGRAPKV